MTVGPYSGNRQRFVDPAECRQRLTDDLVHVVVSVRGQPPDEPDIRRRQRQALVFLEQLLVLGLRDRVIGVAFGRRIFVGERRLGVLLAGQMLVLGDRGCSPASADS